MPKRMDMEGRLFGRLLVVDLAGMDARGERLWHCLCECGKTTKSRTSHLSQGRAQSCGCIAAEKIRDLPKRADYAEIRAAMEERRRQARWEQDRQRTWGRLCPQSYEMRDGHLWWACRCVCGGEKTARAAWIRSGNTQSCGCLNRDNVRALKAQEGRLIQQYKDRQAAREAA